MEEQEETWIVTSPALSGDLASEVPGILVHYSGTKKRGSRQEDYSVSITLSNPARKLVTLSSNSLPLNLVASANKSSPPLGPYCDLAGTLLLLKSIEAVHVLKYAI